MSTWTPEHEAAALRWWDAHVGGPPDWAWLKRPDTETREFLAIPATEVDAMFRDLPPRRPFPRPRKGLLARLLAL